MKNSIKIYSLIFILAISATSCLKDLNRNPYYDLSSGALYSNFENYKLVLAKLYGGLILSGQKGPDGEKDLFLEDEGFSSYMRNYFNMQQIATDETKCRWTDKGIPDMSKGTWSASNDVVNYMYQRIYFQIAQCNIFIRETSDANLELRKITGAQGTEARLYRNEARFLRALSYAHALDLYRNAPLIKENDDINKNPAQATGTELFSYVESELLAIESELKAPKGNEYGRADKAAAWMLLSKLYLNAEVYTGSARNADVIMYTKKVIDAGYQLENNYKFNFNADNNLSSENIFSVNSDGLKTQSYVVLTL